MLSRFQRLSSPAALLLLGFCAPTSAAVWAGINQEQGLATLSLYDSECPGELEHSGVELLCRRGTSGTELTAQLFLFDKVNLGKLWQADQTQIWQRQRHAGARRRRGRLQTGIEWRCRHTQPQWIGRGPTSSSDAAEARK
jgi:hypothetical protein